jgi:phage shock protein E
MAAPVAPAPCGTILESVRMLTKIVLIVLAVIVMAILYLRFGVSRISGDEARKLVQEGALLVDVRSAGEFAGGHIEGAINIPMQDLKGRLDELGDNRSEIVVYCQSGGRSAIAKRLLERNGFENVHDLGGIGQW